MRSNLGRDVLAEEQVNEALEKLNRGIQKTKQMIQLRTIELAQEYFGCSVQTLKQQVKESRAALEDLPKQMPWGQDTFQVLFQELIDNYATIEVSLDEVGKTVANLNGEPLREQGELDAMGAARREARRRDVDLREAKGTGSGGRIVVGDVRRAAKEAEHEDAGKEQPEEANAAKNKAEELGMDLGDVEGTGFGGLITMSDVLKKAR